jgi:penicillin-binding protein 2
MEGADDAAATPITVAEELQDHIVVDEVSPEVVAQIEAHRDRYAGVRIVHRLRRNYPCGAMAAHLVGYLGPTEPTDDPQAGSRPDELVGRSGVERHYESLLKGRRGLTVELLDHGGRLQESFTERDPGPGHDLTLTLLPQLQRAAEELLDSALERRAVQTDDSRPAGGAIVVMDVDNGEVLAAASGPRFEPAVFVGGNRALRESLLDAPSHPLFDRTIQMALPPGSVFKTLTAIALLEAGKLDPHSHFTCQGYLKQPDRQRCAIYVRRGIGHGEVTLADALAQSCNVYFFHHSGNLEPSSLPDWAVRLGFGRPTGVDLPGEAAGVVPTPQTIHRLERHAWRVSDTQTMAIGQGSLTTTPVQIARMMAAVANGGNLVVPHVAKDAKEAGRLPIAGLQPDALAAVREGLERVVADPQGTAHGSVYLDSIAIAGKTGTASIGDDMPEHAWFAGYVPAEKPRYALVVVIERGGDAAVVAGPVVKRLVLRMQDAGLLN